jgi:hypothetical protein
LVLLAKGDVDADCLPHKAVAFLTEANVDFSGDGSSLTRVASTLIGSISFSAVGLGLLTAGLGALAGDVGRFLENRDCDGAGDGDGFGDCAGWGAKDFCGVLYDPDALRSGSSEAGFFGIPGDDVRGEAIESGRGDLFGTSCDPDTLLSSSKDAGVFGVSGVDLLNWPEEMRADFAGGAGLSTRDCRGFLVTGSSSDVPLVLEGTELGRTCSGFTKGTAVISAVTFSGTVFSGSVAVCLAAGALRFGPRARPLVMCCKSGAGPVFAPS